MRYFRDMRNAWLICVLLAGANVIAQTDAKPKAPQFDVVSIKLNHSGQELGLVGISPGGDRLIVTNAPMYRIVEFAYDFQRNDLIVGAPEWARTERWDIDATIDADDLAAFRALSFVQQRAMLRGVLADRCKLVAHVEKKEVPVFALQVARSGLKMHETKPAKEGWDLTEKHGELHGRGVPIAALLYGLSKISLERQIVDQTGLKGAYDFDLIWTPTEDPESSDATRPSLFTAVEEQLGLRLVATRAQVDALVIERIERPTAN
jgi:uncharacterized protein (TIGR03435 family)